MQETLRIKPCLGYVSNVTSSDDFWAFVFQTMCRRFSGKMFSKSACERQRDNLDVNGTEWAWDSGAVGESRPDKKRCSDVHKWKAALHSPDIFLVNDSSQIVLCRLSQFTCSHRREWQRPPWTPGMWAWSGAGRWSGTITSTSRAK